MSRKVCRKLTDQEQAALVPFQEDIHYSTRYKDDDFEYRHVILPKLMLKSIPKDYFDHSSGALRLLSEDEWRGLGVTQVSRQSICQSQVLTYVESRMGALRDTSTRAMDLTF